MANSPYKNAGGRYYVCATPQNDNLDLAGFQALTWVQVKNVGSVPESGITTNFSSYDTLDAVVSQGSKGLSTAGRGTLECARIPSDPGQVIMRTIGHPEDNNNYAFKYAHNDPDDTVYYNRGKVAGPNHPGGRVEDFVVETYTFNFNQVEVVGTEA